MEDPVFGVEPPTGQPVSGRFSQDKMKRFISLCRKKHVSVSFVEFQVLVLDPECHCIYILFIFEFNSIKCKLLNR